MHANQSNQCHVCLFSFRYWENSLVELLIIEAIANCLDVGLEVAIIMAHSWMCYGKSQ